MICQGLPGSIFQHRFGQTLLQRAVFFFQLFEPFGIGQTHVAVFLLPALEGGFRDVVRPADFRDGLASVGLTQDADDLFGAVFLLFHEYFLLVRVRSTLIQSGANLWGHSIP